jgi:nicotinate phosphoribosyltransferase
VRLDSGDPLILSRQVRTILDEAGLTDAKIMVSGDLDEYKIRELLAAGAPVDAFGVGTQLSVSADAPNLSAIYKLVELDIGGIKRFSAKFSEDKISLPGSKQVFRDVARDVVARSGECGRGEAMLRPVMLGGHLIEPLPTLDQSRARAAQCLAALPPALRALEPAEPWPVILSRELKALIEQTRSNLPV